MKPIELIFLIMLLQISVYYILDSSNMKGWKYLILAAVLLMHFIVLPAFYTQGSNQPGDACGMPVIGRTFGFWIFGGGLTLLTHILYKVIADLLKAKHNGKR